MTGGRSVWRSPRHIAVSLGVALVGALLTSPPLVEAVLEATGEPVFVFEERRVGDRGTYFQFLQEVDGTVQVDARTGQWTQLDWIWAEPVTFWIEPGVMATANVFHATGDGPLGTITARVLVEPGTDEFMGVESARFQSTPLPPFDNFQPSSLQPLAWHHQVGYIEWPIGEWHCPNGFPADGLQVHRDQETIPVVLPCFGPGDGDSEVVGTMRPIQLEESPTGDLLTIEYASDETDNVDRIVYVFQEGVSAPVRIEVRWSIGTVQIMELHNFTQGTGPPLASDSEPRAVGWAMVEPFTDDPLWPVIEEGIDPEISFASTYATAAAHPVCGPRLTEFLTSHPDAYVFIAQSALHIRSDGVEKRSWWFRLGDAQEAVESTVSTVPGAPSAATCTIEAVTYVSADVQPAARDPNVPWPRALDLLANYDAFVDDGNASKQYGWTVGCFGGCNDGPAQVRQVRAGHLAYLYPAASAPDPGQSPASTVSRLLLSTAMEDPEEMELHMLGWWPGRTGGPWALDAMTEARTMGSPQAETLTVPPPERAAPLDAAASTGIAWDWTGQNVAWWVTLFGAVVGLIYYLAPVLRESAFFGLFSRVRHEDLLVNAKRRRIHAAIRAEPGIHLHELARVTDVAVGTVRHHLGKLVEGRLVTVRHSGRYACYFVNGATAPLEAIVKAATARRLLELVHQRPGIRQADAARELTVSPATVHRHARRLHQGGLLVINKKNGAATLLTAPSAP